MSATPLHHALCSAGADGHLDSGPGSVKMVGKRRFLLNWKTEKDSGRHLPQFVLTRKDGVQHRAFFSFR